MSRFAIQPPCRPGTIRRNHRLESERGCERFLPPDPRVGDLRLGRACCAPALRDAITPQTVRSQRWQQRARQRPHQTNDRELRSTVREVTLPFAESALPPPRGDLRSVSCSIASAPEGVPRAQEQTEGQASLLAQGEFRRRDTPAATACIAARPRWCCG